MRRRRRVRLPSMGVVMAFAILAGCGRKGPPLPPLRPVPNRIAEVVARRVEGRVELRFTIPSTNADNSTPPAIGRVDVYARSVPEGSPRPVREQMAIRENLVGSIAVKLPASENEAESKDQSSTGAPNPAAPPKPAAPPDTRPAAGDPVRFTDAIPSEAPKPLPPLKQPNVPPVPVPVPATAAPAAPAKPAPPTRYYLLIPAAIHGQLGAPSELIAVPLTPAPPPPTDLELTYDEKTLTATWKSAGGTAFNVYEVKDPAGEETTGRPLGTSPAAKPEYHEPVAFGPRRCLEVRAAETAGAVALESPPLVGCATPKDTFPPAAPTGFEEPFVDSGTVTLRWSAVAAPDLAGYVVLRREGPNGTLQQLTPAPIAETTYRDTDVRIGATYIYTVVAVDKTGNKSPESEPRTAVVR